MCARAALLCHGDDTHREVLSGLKAREKVLLLGPEGPGQAVAPCPVPGQPGSGDAGAPPPTDQPPPPAPESTSARRAPNREVS